MQLLKLLAVVVFMTQSFYNLSIQDTTQQTVSFSSLQGKTVMIVNIATSSDKVSQLLQLQQLQTQFADSLVVIGFPSNSFGNENRNDSAIKAFCESAYHTSFLLATKAPVVGEGIQPVYQWLTTLSENGNMKTPVKTDFQKYIIDKRGSLVAVFAGSVLPLDSNLVSDLTTIINQPL